MVAKMHVNLSEYFTSNPAMTIDNDTMTAYSAIWDVQTSLMPAICILGFATNLLSLMVFLDRSLRHLSCSVYLAAKAVSDFLFLLTVFIIWLSRMEFEVFHTSGICQIVIFLSYLTAFISIWLAVTLTVENLLCVIKPWYVQRTCNAYSASVITTIIVVLGISLYHFSLWNNGVRSIYLNQTSSLNITFSTPHTDFSRSKIYNKSLMETDEYKSVFSNSIYETNTYKNTNGNYKINISDTESVKMCMVLEEFTEFIVATTYIDSLLTLIIPILILVAANTAIVILAIRTTRRRSRLHKQKRQYQLPGTHLANHRKSSASLETQASRFLFAVSMTTLLFHLPSHMVRLKSMVFSVTRMNNLLQRVFETLYYTHYAIGFFVYLIFGINFRKVFFQLVARRSH